MCVGVCMHVWVCMRMCICVCLRGVCEQVLCVLLLIYTISSGQCHQQWQQRHHHHQLQFEFACLFQLSPRRGLDSRAP